MKKITFLIAVLLALSSPLIAQEEEETPMSMLSKCPVTQMTDYKDSCLTCHEVRGGLFTLKQEKERDPDELYKYPNRNTKIRNNIGYYLVGEVDSFEIEEFFLYMDRHNINHVVIEIFSPGGSLYQGLRIVGLFKHWQNKGFIIETHCYGASFSAGFLVFASGTKGYRAVSPEAECMWHEIQSYKWSPTGVVATTPSDEEQSAEILRHLQDTVDTHLAEVSNLTKEEIDRKVKYEEYWINGKQALECGFADELL